MHCLEDVRGCWLVFNDSCGEMMLKMMMMMTETVFCGGEGGCSSYMYRLECFCFPWSGGVRTV